MSTSRPVQPDPAADPLAWLRENSGELVKQMGIRYEDASVDSVVASMPVAGNRQGYELLHGGASVVLAETVGSALAVLATGFAKQAVGLEVNASHHRSARSGHVRAVARVDHLGRTAATVAVTITDDQDRRVCSCRITCILRDRS